MTLCELGVAVNQIVQDLKTAKMYKHRGVDEIWPKIENALQATIEAARMLEEGWGDGGDAVS